MFYSVVIINNINNKYLEYDIICVFLDIFKVYLLNLPCWICHSIFLEISYDDFLSSCDFIQNISTSMSEKKDTWKINVIYLKEMYDFLSSF